MASVTVDKRTGNLVVRAYAGINPDTRKPRTESETLPKDSSEADIAAAKERVDARAAVTKGNTALMTVGTLLDWHLDAMEADGASPTTMSSYRSYRRRHVGPRIGGRALAKVATADFSAFYRDLRRPKEKGGAALSASTVEKIHAMLSGCFSHAKTDGLIKANPLAEMKMPRPKPPEAKALPPDELGRLTVYLMEELAAPLDVGDDAAVERRARAVAVWIAVNTGMRRGELAALTRDCWRSSPRPALRVREALVYATGQGIVRKAPKSAASVREESLDADTALVVSAWMEAQWEALWARGAEIGPDTPLVSHPDGSAFEPGEVAEAFREVCRATGMPAWVHLHSLRHTHATYLLMGGEDMRTVQERLGHSSVNVTLGTYGHVMPGRDAQAADSFAEERRRLAGQARGPGVPTCPLSGAPCARFAKSDN